MNVNLIILISSVTVQAANAVLAVRLILHTKKYLAGGMIISAVSLMAFRRAISLYRYVGSEELAIDPAAESVALVISLLFFAGILYVTRIIESEVRSRREKEEMIAGLRTALAEIKTLKGIVPICASCKKIRDDKGYWNKLEQYLGEHLAAEFSHGLCPQCAEKLYPDLPLGQMDRKKTESEDSS
jgi:hypothetical protein